MIKIGATEEQILYKIVNSINTKLDSVGIFNRVFARIKTKSSIIKKLTKKEEEYKRLNKKMQDLFGIRVTLYFADDEDIAIELVKNLFVELPESHNIDELSKDQFKPIKKNLVFRIPDELKETSNLFDHDLIDSTFEVQFRTIFSEGWHEVEHDMRYKCLPDWSNEDVLYRQLNGLLAVLETSDWAMLKIFDELSYKKYKLRQWNSFFRNLVRIRFEDEGFSEEIVGYLNSNPNIARELLKKDRTTIMKGLINLRSKLPLKMDNVFFIINRVIILNEDIKSMESSTLKNILDESFNLN